MIVADVFFWFLIVVGLMAVLNSYWLAAWSLFPGRVKRAVEGYRRPLRATVVGLLLFVPFVLLAFVLVKLRHPVANLLAIGGIGIPVTLGLLGSAGFARRLGLGLESPRDDSQAWRPVLRGGVVFFLTMLLPFVGWFLLLPWALISGFGVFVLGELARRREAREAGRKPLAPDGETPGSVSQSSPPVLGGQESAAPGQ